MDRWERSEPVEIHSEYFFNLNVGRYFLRCWAPENGEGRVYFENLKSAVFRHAYSHIYDNDSKPDIKAVGIELIQKFRLDAIQLIINNDGKVEEGPVLYANWP